MNGWLQIKNNIQSNLASISKILEEVKALEYTPDFEIPSKDLFSLHPKNSALRERIKAHFSNFQDSVIYTVALKGCEDYKSINTAFSKATSTKKEQRDYSKHNNRQSGLLYVGSSQSKYLVTRVRNHLGIGARKVYSMHIKAWLPPDLDCIIIIRVLQVQIPDNNIKSVKILELVEQGLWDANNPLFGKRNGLL